jgi:thiosulfate/3-mercaptopyruvate sulfurtransferase
MVTTDWLEKHKDDQGVVLVDMSDYMQYSRFHIPGAIHLDYSDIVMRRKRDKVSVRLSGDHLFKVLGAVGISANDHVVLYDDTGGLNAGRLFWELERIGHKKISIVDGGQVKWILEGRKVTNKSTERKPVVYQASDQGRDNEAFIADVMDFDNREVTVLDVRSDREYAGHPRIPRSGHIPGAKWWPWEDNLDIENAFVLSKTEIVNKKLQKLGVTDKKQPLLVYCRSGHRAAQSYLTLRNLGYENVKLYDGSMAEYSLNKNNPLKKGMLP